jgi:hypothetical protein
MLSRSEPVLRRSHLVWLGLILAAGLALRAAYFEDARHTAGYAWEDPDQYVTKALTLVGPGGHWRWTFDAVTYDLEGRRHALPPGYSIFLSLFALFPGFPLTAQIAQILLAVASIALVFDLGRTLHSPWTGVVAAAGYAIWVPNIFGVWSTSQETLYLPLVLLGFALWGRAMAADWPPPGFVLVGATFGLAALTRSMPMFFIVPATLAHVGQAPGRRRASLQAAALIAGFLLLTVPYSVALSRHFGQLALVDTHGSIHFDVASVQTPPRMGETLAALAKQITTRPVAFTTECAYRARTLFHVNGGRILQIYVVARTRAAARIWKVLVHSGADGLLILASLLATLGAAACRHRRLAVLLLLWTGINIGIASLGGFGGARLRVPFEPLLLVLAAVVLTGGWQRPRAVWLGAAAAVTILMGFTLVPQVPRSLAAWPDYGVEWPSIFSRHGGRFTGAAGFSVFAPSGVAEFSATAPADPAAAQVTVSAGTNGVRLATADLGPGETRRFRTLCRPGLAFIEVAARRTADGAPATVAISVSR